MLNSLQRQLWIVMEIIENYIGSSGIGEWFGDFYLSIVVACAHS